MTVPFAKNSVFLEAITLLIDLQFAVCKDDEDQADVLRDALDILLNKLSWEANEWLRGLSGDLDMLCNQEVFEPNELSTIEYQRSLMVAWKNIESDPAAVLVLLRKEQQILPADAVAYFRARAYHLLDLPAIRTLFLRRAVELDPKCVPYKIFLLNSLWSDGKLVQARPLAEAILEDKASEPDEILLTAAFLHRIIQKVSPKDRVALGKLRSQIEGGMRSIPSSSSMPNLAGFGFMLLGMISETLNRTTQARESYSQACDLMPGEEAPFLVRGRLMFKVNEQKALPDFRRAVNLGTSDPFPYLILARESLKAGDYADCQALCLSVMQLGGPMVQGQAYEFMAIAEIQTHGETDLAQQYLDEAHRLFPSDKNIQRNQAAFEAARQERTHLASPRPKASEKYSFDLQTEYEPVKNDILDLMLRAKSSQIESSQIWADSNPLNVPFGLAA